MSEVVEHATRRLKEMSPTIAQLSHSRVRDLVRAVIEEMREPTFAMWSAGAHESDDTTLIWQAMIDEALR